MSDTPTPNPTEPHDESTGSDHDAQADGRSHDLRALLDRAALAALVLLAVIAGLRFYLAASSTIDQWIVREYRSLFHATFNLALLLLAGYGISVQLRRMR